MMDHLIIKEMIVTQEEEGKRLMALIVAIAWIVLVGLICVLEINRKLL